VTGRTPFQREEVSHRDGVADEELGFAQLVSALLELAILHDLIASIFWLSLEPGPGGRGELPRKGKSEIGRWEKNEEKRKRTIL